MSFHPFGATIGNLVPPLTVANGGTGSTTASGARTGLGLAYDATASDIQPNGTGAAGANGLVTDSGHVHPAANGELSPGPAIQGLLGWTWDIAANGTTSGTIATGGTLYLAMIPLPKAVTITNIVWQNAAAAITPTVGQSQVGIYNAAGSLVASATPAQTATSMVLANNIICPLSATFAAAAGNYWVGAVFQAATEPSILRSGTNSGTVLNINLAGATLRSAVNGTGITTALPSSITTSSNTITNSNPYWFGLS